jgi:hypothetical protein
MMDSTILIAVIAATLIVLTIGVWRLAGRLAKCCAQNDARVRGWLFPVVPILYREGTGEASILARLGNFGRLPSILKESYLERRASEPSGAQATYQGGRLLPHDLVLDVGAHEVNLPAPAFPIDGKTTSYVVGYFRYLDVSGSSHLTRYCYRIEAATGKIERAGSAAWNAFD